MALLRFSSAVQDVGALADALDGTTDVPAALAAYEAARLASARSLVRGGQEFSRSFAA